MECKYLNYHGLPLPRVAHSEESLKYFENFQVNDDDVFAVTYPKSGRLMCFFYRSTKQTSSSNVAFFQYCNKHLMIRPFWLIKWSIENVKMTHNRGYYPWQVAGLSWYSKWVPRTKSTGGVKMMTPCQGRYYPRKWLWWRRVAYPCCPVDQNVQPIFCFSQIIQTVHSSVW